LPARFLQEHDEIEPAEPSSAVRLGDRQSRPTELRDFPPELDAEAGLLLTDAANFAERTALGKKFVDLAA